MPRTNRFWLNPWLLLAILTGLLAARPVQAQSGQVNLLAPDTSRFPTIGLTFEAFDSQTRFVGDLQKSEIEVLENGVTLPVQELSRIQPGLQVVVAINPGATLSYLTNNLSRLDQVKKALTDWLRTQPSNGPDDFGLLAGTSALGSHLPDPQLLVQALAGYATDLSKTQPALNGLSAALDLAGDPLRRPLMKRAILFITPLINDSLLQDLPTLTQRAVQQGVRVFVWLMLPNTAPETKVTAALSEIANRSGGKFFAHTGSEAFPNIEGYFQPLRSIYRVTYTSTTNKTANNAVTVRITRPSLALSSPEQRFSLNLQPPNPIILEPPARIQRSVSGTGENGVADLLQPASIALRMIIEFPDGIQRPMRAARLFVDGKLVQEITSAPFDRLEWPLAGFSSGKHLVRLEVEDQLGLTRSSIETPIELQISTQSGLQNIGQVPWNVLLPAGGTILVIGLVGAGIVVISRRHKKKPSGSVERQPRPRLRQVVPQPALHRIPPGTNAPARLMRISENGHILPGSAVPLALPELTIGSDAKRSMLVLETPCIEPVHTRLRQADGEFFLHDAGSVAGTWVNYRLAPQDGICLKHGDRIQIGMETFRFELNQPGPAPAAAITPYEE